MKVIALIPAAGSGSRMSAKEKKPYLSLGDKPILAHTLSEFEQCSLINEVILIVSKDAIDYCKTSIVEAFKVKKVNKVIAGGPRRQDSVWEGLKILKDDCKLVMVHDRATVAAVPVKDTIKIVSKQAEVVETIDRSRVWAVQTPQTFTHNVLKMAYEKAFEEGFYGTDDASLVERLGIKVKIIPGSYDNIKITTPGDLVLGDAVLKRRASKMHDS
ncbi:MAG: 2-C-methyl-D-erythritol 4-phosphate cytidylyltransferase [Deltaproteobacteria bacterium]|nr:2-C-methyl-D-erythritol 4-phosphate cytidylyltransferase [Deltaproteobacteria bacterium]